MNWPMCVQKPRFIKPAVLRTWIVAVAALAVLQESSFHAEVLGRRDAVGGESAMVSGDSATVTLDFDSVSLPVGGCINATSYLASFGITFASVSGGASPSICNSAGSLVAPTSSPNVFYADPAVTNTNESYDLFFQVPLRQLSFTRATLAPAIAAPPWSATAYDASGNPLSTVSRGTLFPGAPAESITLAGPGITRVRFAAFNSAHVTMNHPPIDNLILSPVCVTPAITTQPVSQTRLTGQTAQFGAAASGAPTVQWQVSADKGSTWTNITGATAETYSFIVGPLDDGKQFRAVFTNACGTAITSPALLVVPGATVTLTFDAPQLPAGGCVNATSYLASFEIAFVSESGGASPSICNTAGSLVTATSGTNVFYADPAVTNTNESYVLIFPVPLRQVSFTRATLASTIAAPPWSATAYDASGKQLSTVSRGTLFPGAPAESITLTGPGITRVRFAAFNSAHVTMNHPPIDNMILSLETTTVGICLMPVITTQPVSQWRRAGQTVQFTAAVGGSPTPTVQWQVSADGGTTWADLVGATGATYSFIVGQPDDRKQFRAVFKTPCSTAFTNPATLFVRRAGARTVSMDFDGDGSADLIRWRASTGTWYWLLSSEGYADAAQREKQFGEPGDMPMLGDVDGDGLADPILWRASTGTWYWLTSSSGYDFSASRSKQWGNSSLGDKPMLGDVDGDGVVDLIVWRASTGTWFWLTSSSGYDYAAQGNRQWGNSSLGDTPMLGDIDGDGKSDLMVWRASTGTWFWLISSTGYSYATQGGKQWGSQNAGDVPMSGDIDGDGKIDLIVWRAPTGTWYWLTSSSGFNYGAQGQKQWGSQTAGDVPLIADLDGDGKSDLVAWRGASDTWFWLTSSTAYNYATAGVKLWGSKSSGDMPVR